MSGPVSTADARPDLADGGHAEGPTLEVVPSREATVGGIDVRRALPRRQRRCVGAWCFADHFGPVAAESGAGMRVGPHPHIGLQTVTWLVAGEVLHTDSLGSEQLIRPGQVNLMTAGRGVAHAEETPSTYSGELHGIQLWVAQPDVTRYRDPSFEHHAELPVVELGSCLATVLVGTLAGARSPARRETGLLGVELAAAGGSGDAIVPLEAAFEHGVIVLTGEMTIAGRLVQPGSLAYVGAGRDELPVGLGSDARGLLLGGRPCTENLVMWWNFVARTRGEIEQAWREWERGTARFGPVSSNLARIPAPRPAWLAPEPD
jgi:redox-sensitive bicupin YhaK (pirin superfamily)